MTKLKRVLCFGDSNTWGFRPEDAQRYPYHERWPGILATHLGPNWQIIEEGLNGRTTDVDYPPPRLHKAAKPYLYPCLDSHSPLDFVILFLGANDMKSIFARTPEQIAFALDSLVKIILGQGLERPSPEVKVLLVGPPRIFEAGQFANDFRGAEPKSRELGALLEKVAENNHIDFVNLFGAIEPSPVDGLHFSKEANLRIAEIFYERLLSHVDHI